MGWEADEPCACYARTMKNCAGLEAQDCCQAMQESEKGGKENCNLAQVNTAMRHLEVIFNELTSL